MKSLKKSFAVVLAGLFALTVLAVWNVNEVKAASGAKLELSTAQGYEGDTVKVTVSLTQNPGIAGLNFAIAYDKKALTVVSAKAVDGPWLGALATIEPDGEADGVGFVGYAYAVSEDSANIGDLLTVEFKVNEGAAIGDIALTLGDASGNFDASNFNQDTVELTKQDGKITVLCRHGKTSEKTTPATCIEAGSRQTVCDACGEVLTTDTIAALGHKYGEYTTTKEPSCTEKGVRNAVCSVCGEKVTEEINALGHKYSEYTIVKDATDKEAGEMKRLCTICKEEIITPIPVVKTEDFQLIEAGGEILKTEYIAGDSVKFTAWGLGMDNAAPQAGDIRYVPASWKLDKETKWNGAPYTANLNLEAEGTYELVIAYNREIYEASGWKADGKTYTAKNSITVAQKTATQDDEKSDNNVATGDADAFVITALLLACVLSGAVVLVSMKRKKSVVENALPFNIYLDSTEDKAE